MTLETFWFEAILILALILANGFFAASEIAMIAMRKSRVSLMPEGLLRDATDQELADLFAHLQTLRGSGNR